MNLPNCPDAESSAVGSHIQQTLSSRLVAACLVSNIDDFLDRRRVVGMNSGMLIDEVAEQPTRAQQRAESLSGHRVGLEERRRPASDPLSAPAGDGVGVRSEVGVRRLGEPVEHERQALAASPGTVGSGRT